MRHDPRTVRKWACGVRGIPETVRRLLLACERDPSLVGVLDGVAP